MLNNNMNTDSKKKYPHPYLNRCGHLPEGGMIFDAEDRKGKTSNVVNKFVKTSDVDPYYTNNHFGNIENGESPFYKVVNTKK